jgi:5'-nucleotidase
MTATRPQARFRSRRRTLAILLAPLVIAPLAAAATPAAQAAPAVRAGSVTAQAAPAAGAKGTPAFTLTVLHNNDGESQLLGAPGQPDFGGVARFKTLVDQLKRQAKRGAPGPGEADKRGVVMLSSGDNFLAGPEFTASLEKGVPFYDSIALKAVGYDALAIGNHEFDFGPEVLADFIEGFDGTTKFVSKNLKFTEEPRLQELVEAKILLRARIVLERKEKIGIIGATTPQLRSISSPRDVEILDNVRELVQRKANYLKREWGVNKIILISHLQNIQEDLELIPQLKRIDVAVAGGGDELLANEGDLLVPGDEVATDPETGEPLRYPLVVEDKRGRSVPVVTTAGAYKYVGRLAVTWNKKGRVLGWSDESGPVRVSGVAPDAVAPNPEVQRLVTDPVSDFVADLENNEVASTQVDLDGRREFLRTEETNLGDLMADALLSTGREEAAEFGVEPPDMAIQNGGGIRIETVLPAGPITELDTFSIAPFPNFVAVVPDIPRSQAKQLIEHSVSQAPLQSGGFAQVAGFRFTYDPDAQAQVVDEDGNVVTPGERVRELVLNDGTVIVADGEVVDGAPVSLATNDFTARGGDGYPFRGVPFTAVGRTYQQALVDFLTTDLGGVVRAADYPEGGAGRISTTG